MRGAMRRGAVVIRKPRTVRIAQRSPLRSLDCVSTTTGIGDSSW